MKTRAIVSLSKFEILFAPFVEVLRVLCGSGLCSLREKLLTAKNAKKNNPYP
jgi:hypothetical protein